jgi:ribosome biogenesis GTPase
VVVGDRIEVVDGYVAGVAARNSTLSRAVGPQRQLMAANVDRVVLVLAAGRALREGFLMRGLAATAAQGLPVMVVVNKMDLEEAEEARERLGLWRRLGICCFAGSAVTGEGMDILRAATETGTSVLMGHSGVGKSTLVNILRKGADRRTGELDWQGKGRHVTTMAEAMVTQHSMLIDLPGVRELGLWGATPEQVLEAFPDVRRAVERCHFDHCSHGDEVGCGLHAAIDARELDPLRAERCLRIQASVASGTEGGGRW